MFLHLFKYRIKYLFRTKDLLLWTILFPLVLGTMFYFAFGSMMNSDEENLKSIPIALVSEADNNAMLENVIDEISNDDTSPLFKVTKTDEDTAINLLENGEVDAIIYSCETPSITIQKNGLNQTITKTFLEQYLQQEYLIKQVIFEHPEKLLSVVSQLQKNITYNNEISLTNKMPDTLSWYFYALIAMTCLYGANLGMHSVVKLQPNLSTLGARRAVSPTHKIKVILSDFLASVVVSYLSILLLIFYLTIILHVDLGNKIGGILIASFVGALVGISLGTFIGALGKGSAEKKTAILMTFCMTCSFPSGLMFNLMKDIIEHTCPIINRINPGAIISDAFYALNMYNNYDRFIKDIIIMGIMTIVLNILNYYLLRRNKYASI